MIYLFYGSDTDRARRNWRKVRETFAGKYPDGNIFSFSAEHFDQGSFEELVSSADLFGTKRLVLVDRLLENEEAAEFVGSKIKEIAESGTVFAFLETTVLAPLVKKIEKAGGKLEKSEAKGKEQRGFNVFAITDAFGARDRKQTWILFQQALEAGLAGEEIFWRLVWQVKTMLLIRRSSGSVKSLKSFVADKAARFNRNFKDGELEKTSRDLVALWHESVSDQPRDLEIGLEQLILHL